MSSCRLYACNVVPVKWKYLCSFLKCSKEYTILRHRPTVRTARREGHTPMSETKKIAWPPPLPSLSQLGRRQTIFQRFPNTCVNVQLSHKSQNDPEAKTRSESLQIGMLFKPNWVQTARAFQAPPLKKKRHLYPSPKGMAYSAGDPELGVSASRWKFAS